MARRIRLTSATCSALRRTAASFCRSISSSTCTASCCRSSGQRSTLASNSLSIFLVSSATARYSIAAGLQPALEIDQRLGALVFVGLLEGALVELADPPVLGLGAVAREGQPHQPARGLA